MLTNWLAFCLHGYIMVSHEGLCVKFNLCGFNSIARVLKQVIFVEQAMEKVMGVIHSFSLSFSPLLSGACWPASLPHLSCSQGPVRERAHRCHYGRSTLLTQ